MLILASAAQLVHRDNVQLLICEAANVYYVRHVGSEYLTVVHMSAKHKPQQGRIRVMFLLVFFYSGQMYSSNFMAIEARHAGMSPAGGTR